MNTAQLPTSIEAAVTINETERGRDFWLSQGLGKTVRSQLAIADVILVPEKDFREGIPFVFHQDTTTLLRYLSTNTEGQFTVELCADDDEYQEIALHSATFRLGAIFVTCVAVPVVVNLMSSYVYDELKAKPSDTVEASLIVEDHECKSFKFSFKGEAKDFHQLADQVGQMARDCSAKQKKANSRGDK